MNKKNGIIAAIAVLLIGGFLLFGNTPAEDAAGRLSGVAEVNDSQNSMTDGVRIYETDDPRRNLEDVEVRHVDDRPDDMEIAPEEGEYDESKSGDCRRWCSNGIDYNKCLDGTGSAEDPVGATNDCTDIFNKCFDGCMEG